MHEYVLTIGVEKMSNFTVAIPDNLLTDSKIMAAKTGVSLNALIRNLLEGFIQMESPPFSGNFEILFRYSLGQLTAKKAANLLHLDDEEALQMMTLNAGFPIPRLSSQESESMQKRFSDMLDRHSA